MIFKEYAKQKTDLVFVKYVLVLFYSNFIFNIRFEMYATCAF